MADLRPEHEVRERKELLDALSDGELYAWARQAGVPYPEMFHSERPYGQRLTRGAARQRVRNILLREYKWRNRAAEMDLVANQWWNYYGGAAGDRPVGSADHQQLTAPRTLDALLRHLTAGLAEGPVPISTVGGGHSVSEAALPKVDALFLDLSLLARIDPGPVTDGLDFVGIGEDVRNQEQALGRARTLFERWQEAEVHDPAARAAALAELDGHGHVVRVPAGIPLHLLNYILWANGFALLNLGNFAEQSLWGAATTGTHGSGANLQPLASAILSVDLVVVSRAGPNGALVPQVLRVEPANGISAPGPFATSPARAGWELVSSDSLFHALTVSIGNMGVAFAVTIRVVDRYTLSENHQAKVPWEELVAPFSNKSDADDADEEDLLEVAERLAFGDGGDRHRTLLINPYHRRDHHGPRRHAAVLQRRYDQRWEDYEVDIAKPVEDTLKDWKNYGPTYTYGQIVGGRAHANQAHMTDRLGLALQVLVDDPIFTGRGYRALTGGNSYFVMGTACEIAVPLETMIPAVYAVLDLIERDDLLPTVPISLRFVKASRDWLSPAYFHSWGREVEVFCFIEVLTTLDPLDADGPWRIFDAVLRLLCTSTYRGRPHWGLYNRSVVAAGPPAIRDWYGDEAVDSWSQARCFFDPHGLFGGRFGEYLPQGPCARAQPLGGGVDAWLPPLLPLIFGRAS